MQVRQRSPLFLWASSRLVKRGQCRVFYGVLWCFMVKADSQGFTVEKFTHADSLPAHVRTLTTLLPGAGAWTFFTGPHDSIFQSDLNPTCSVYSLEKEIESFLWMLPHRVCPRGVTLPPGLRLPSPQCQHGFFKVTSHMTPPELLYCRAPIPFPLAHHINRIADTSSTRARRTVLYCTSTRARPH